MTPRAHSTRTGRRSSERDSSHSITVRQLKVRGDPRSRSKRAGLPGRANCDPKSFDPLVFCRGGGLIRPAAHVDFSLGSVGAREHFKLKMIGGVLRKFRFGSRSIAYLFQQSAKPSRCHN